MHVRRLTLKALIATSAAVLAAGITPALAPGGGDAHARGGPACMLTFSVNATEDVLPDGDEPYLKVKTIFWDAPQSMDEPALAPVGVTVHYGDVVQAWDEDPGPDKDDFIGSDTVTRDKHELNFEGDDGAWYSAEYQPTAC